MNEKKRSLISIIICVLAIFYPLTEIIRQFLLFTNYSVSECIWYLPFQLCSMPLYLMPIYALTKNPWVESALIDFSLLGGIFVFFDQSGLQYDIPLLTVHAYLWHGLMIVTGLFLAFTSKRKRTMKDYLPAALILLIFAAIATILNLVLHQVGEINFFYISPLRPMTQVVFRDIAAVTGDHLGRLIYLLCILLGGAIFHALSICAGKIIRRAFHG